LTPVTCYGQVIESNHRYPMDLSLFYIISDIKLASKKNTKLDISRCRIQCYINKVRMKITSGRIRIQMFQADDRLIKKARGTDKLKKIAVIHDLSGMGKCSLTAAIPVISAMGVQACPLPTAVLSNQTGYGSYFWDDYTDRMQLIMDEWKKMGFKPDGVYTGFLADARQVDVILKFTDMFCTDETHILIDPVMGDGGNIYRTYSEELCEKMRILVQHATVITPNLTEALLLLYGEQGMKEKMELFSQMDETQQLKETEKSGRELADRFGLKSIVITGVDVVCGDGSVKMGNLVIEENEADWYFSIKEGGSYSGTGDLFASVLSAGMVKGISMKECVQKAIAFLAGAIHDAVLEGTDRNDGVCFEKYLKML
jgi:pyridoxine kinase